MTNPAVLYPAKVDPLSPTGFANDIPRLGWRAYYPDRIMRAPLRYAAIQASGATYVATPSTFGNDIPRLTSWIGYQPAWIVRAAPYRTANQLAFVSGTTQVTPLDWQPPSPFSGR